MTDTAADLLKAIDAHIDAKTPTYPAPRITGPDRNGSSYLAFDVKTGIVRTVELIPGMVFADVSEDGRCVGIEFNSQPLPQPDTEPEPSRGKLRLIVENGKFWLTDE